MVHSIAEFEEFRRSDAVREFTDEWRQERKWAM